VLVSRESGDVPVSLLVDEQGRRGLAAQDQLP
jgi:hypothetical protein